MLTNDALDLQRENEGGKGGDDRQRIETAALSFYCQLSVITWTKSVNEDLLNISP